MNYKPGWYYWKNVQRPVYLQCRLLKDVNLSILQICYAIAFALMADLV